MSALVAALLVLMMLSPKLAAWVIVLGIAVLVMRGTKGKQE